VIGNGGRKKIRLSADDIDELIRMSDDEKVQRFWQTIKEEKLRGIDKSRRKRFLFIPSYNSFIAIIFVLALLSFGIWFVFQYSSISFDMTQPALLLVFAISAIMFHRYVSDKEQIVGMLDEIAGYSIQNESILENIGIALIVVDAEGKVTKVNSKAEDILEATSVDLVGRNCKSIFKNRELADLLLQTVKFSNPIINYEVASKYSNGRRYLLQVTTSPLKNRKGQIIGAVEVINDVTEVNELQEKLKLNEHLASVGELSAKLGHEIGNSLGGIKLFTDNLIEELAQGDHRRGYAEEILSELDRLMGSIRKLKDYSRPVTLELAETNINEIVDEVVSLTRDRILENGIVVKRDLDRDMPDILVDPDQIKGALLNIVINATQAMPQIGELTIVTQRVNGIVNLSVSDTGCGIPEDIRNRIFDPFFTTKKSLGTGLGLSIVYKAVKAHGGNVECNSKVGKGTTFILSLPAKTETDNVESVVGVANSAKPSNGFLNL